MQDLTQWQFNYLLVCLESITSMKAYPLSEIDIITGGLKVHAVNVLSNIYIHCWNIYVFFAVY